MFSKRKKIIILSVMVALLVVTGYLNIALNNNVSQPVSTIANLNFYESYRADRETSRESAILYYEGIINDSTSSQEAKDMAEASRQELIDALEKELIIEGLIRGIGFEDAVLTTTSDNINVIVKAKAEEITEAQLAQISTIVQEQTQKSLDNIRVICSD